MVDLGRLSVLVLFVLVFPQDRLGIKEDIVSGDSDASEILGDAVLEASKTGDLVQSCPAPCVRD